jgi:lycopene cyclase domain-containing protein
MGSYTVAAVAAVVTVVVAEVVWLRTGLFRRPAYWATMGIVTGFQVPVDGWLTKTSAPVVRYDPRAIIGARFPWDIPVEDFLFGFALVTLVLAVWTRSGARHAAPPASGSELTSTTATDPSPHGAAPSLRQRALDHPAQAR